MRHGHTGMTIILLTFIENRNGNRELKLLFMELYLYIHILFMKQPYGVKPNGNHVTYAERLCIEHITAHLMDIMNVRRVMLIDINP